MADSARVPSKKSRDERDDATLLAAYQDGDVAAFRVLVERHQAPVYRFCLRSLGNKEAATDAAQEVFLRVVKYAPKWEKRAKFTTWLYTIARNYCIDQARKGRFRHTESLDAPIGEDGTARIEQVASDDLASDDVASGKRLRAVVDGILEDLPQEQREVFCLRQYSGLPFKEIAKATGTSENTVKSRMRYALSALKNALLEKGFTSPNTS